MALPKITTLFGNPLTDPWDFFYQSVYDGDLQPPTTSEIVIISDAGNKIVFKGSFTVAGGDVTGGTMTGFAVYAGSTKVMKADGYAVSGAALFDALQTFQVNSESYFDLIFGQALKVVGSKEDDDLDGTEASDVLVGRAGNDALSGWTGDDLMKGGKGNDLLVDGEGYDTMIGGSGNDVFGFYLNPSDPSVGYGKIKDFVPGEDRFELTVVGLDLAPGFLGKDYFHKGTEAATATQVIIYDKASGRIFFDVDGTGIEAQFQFAKVKAGTKLHADDFFVNNFFPV